MRKKASVRLVLVTLGVPLENAKKKEAIAIKLQYYHKKLLKYDLEPVFVWPSLGYQAILRAYNSCDGVLFTGGGDFDAIHYGEENHKNSSIGGHGRDEMEFWLLEKVFNERKPFLGLCRGAQALAIFLGAKIHQHIPDLNIDENHGVSEHLNYKTKSGMVPVKETHEVIINKKTQTYKILKKELTVTNTFHHQAIRPNKNFIVSGKSPAGIVEIIEIPDRRHFCFGIQSHPERFEDSDLEMFFEKFAKAMR